MFRIIQKGGTTLNQYQKNKLKEYYVEISRNGDCLFGSAFRGILELHYNGLGFAKNPIDFFEIDDKNDSYDLLVLNDLSYSKSFLKTVRNFRRYIYDCIIKFLETKNYDAIFDVFKIQTIYELFDFIFYGSDNDTIRDDKSEYFSSTLFNDGMTYIPTVDKRIETEFIELLISHFNEMKIEGYSFDKTVDSEYWGGMVELIFISNIFDVVFYIVNERTSEISNDPVGNALVGIDRSIPIYYRGAHYDSLKRDFIENDSFNGVKAEHQDYIANGIYSMSNGTIKLIKDSCTADVGKDFPQIRPLTKLPIKPSEVSYVKPSQVKQSNIFTFDDIIKKFNEIKNKYSEILKLGFDIYVNPKLMSEKLDTEKNLEIVKDSKKIKISLLDFINNIIMNEVSNYKILKNYYIPVQKLVSELTNYNLRAFTKSIDDKSKKDTLRLIILYLEFYQTFIAFEGKIPK